MKKNHFLILDCETATIPPPKIDRELSEKERKKLAILKPLIYDIAWRTVDRKGEVNTEKHYIVNEIFFNQTLFNTAYYKEKRPIYLQMIKDNLITCKNWNEIATELIQDLHFADFCGAYNSMFDFKKAINFTDDYIQHLYSNYIDMWFEKQNYSMERILSGHNPANTNFDKDYFNYRDRNYPLIDLWGLSCVYLLNNKRFKKFCYANKYSTQSGKFFSTTAETTYRYITNNTTFNESHTALEDVKIEVEILTKILQRVSLKKMEKGIIYFPFRVLGKWQDEEREEV